MNVAELVENLSQQGVQLWVDQDKLRIHSPKGVLTPELRADLAENKAQILAFLQQSYEVNQEQDHCSSQVLNAATIGRLISGLAQGSGQFKAPVINPQQMAQQLKVTFRPLPPNYANTAIIKVRELLEQKLKDYSVQLQPWEEATKEVSYEFPIPFTPWKKTLKIRVVKSSINAVIDVERHPSWWGRIKGWIAEKSYQFYSRFVWQQQKASVSKIAQFIAWADENIRPLEDPTNTQAIVLTQLDPILNHPEVPYQQKIPVGVSTLIRTFSEIVIGVSDKNLSILNMNLSDSSFDLEAIDQFVLKSLIPKIYVPILPLPMSRFAIETYDSTQSNYAAQLVQLGQSLKDTGLLPSGFQINQVIKRQSHRDIVDWMVNGRTGVSYGFIAYAEPPQYVGAKTLSQLEWDTLSLVEGFNSQELRQNALGRRYLKTQIGNQTVYQQLPDIWLVSSRSGANKTNLNLATDVLRIGLTDRLVLQMPQGTDSTTGDIKPSYDIYVMVAIALATALYAPELLQNGAPIVHFHGYPAHSWFNAGEYCFGMDNPSVPCGTYESGVFNFLGLAQLTQPSTQQSTRDIKLVSLIEPDHGTNIIAADPAYLIQRLQTGIAQQQIELGGKHFPSLKQSAAT